MRASLHDPIPLQRQKLHHEYPSLPSTCFSSISLRVWRIVKTVGDKSNHIFAQIQVENSLCQIVRLGLPWLHLVLLPAGERVGSFLETHCARM